MCRHKKKFIWNWFFNHFFQQRKKKSAQTITHQFVRIFIEKYREKIELLFYLKNFFFRLLSPDDTTEKKTFFFIPIEHFLFSPPYIYFVRC